MKYKTSELEGQLLDRAVVIALGLPLAPDFMSATYVPAWGGVGLTLEVLEPSSEWEHGGPIIERERITIAAPTRPEHADWMARMGERPFDWHGPTPLIAAMRAYVASKLGDEVELP
jgi:hypothetical protein